LAGDPEDMTRRIPDGPASTDLESWSREAIETPISWKDWVPPPELRRQPTTVRPPRASGPAVVTIDGTPAAAVSGDLVLAGVVVLTMVMTAVFAVVSLLPRATSAVATAAGSLPERGELLWSVSVDARVGSAVTGSGVVVVDGRDRVEAFDAFTGGRLWSLAAPGEPLARELLVIDGVAIVVDRRGGGAQEIVAVEAGSGETLWNRSDPSGAVRIVENRLLEFGVRDFGATGRRKTLRLVDPRSGDAIGPRFGMSETEAPMPRITSVDDNGVTVYDVDSGRRLGPTVDGPRLRSVDVVDGVIVGFDDASRIVVFDERGDRTDERQFASDAFGDFRGRAELIGAVPGHDLAILSSGSSIGFRVGSGNAEVAWQVDGRVGTPVVTDVGPVSVARVIDATTGEVNHALVAAVTGETLAVTDPGETREAEPEVRQNGYIVAPEVGGGPRVLRAFDFAGDQLWSVALPVNASFVLADGSLVVVHRTLDSTTISGYG
jgi:outer membrane protein assembly factor BamB